MSGPPEQIGVTERRNGILMNMIRSMINLENGCVSLTRVPNKSVPKKLNCGLIEG